MANIKPLSMPQLLILSTAAQRPNRMILPLPSTLRARGASQHRLPASLLKLGLVEGLPATEAALSWRTNDDGQRYALRLTEVGLAAVTGPTETQDITDRSADAESDGEPVTENVDTAAELAPASKAEQAFAEDRPSGKLGQILNALGAKWTCFAKVGSS
jgi:hypothetical protein